MPTQPPPTGNRPLSTSARVHPPYLPYLHNAASRTKSPSLKWIPPLAAAAALSAGYALTTMTSYRSDSSSSTQSHQQQYQQRRGADGGDEQRRQREMGAVMAEAYGERGSLEELEAAVRAYEAARRG